MHHFQRQPLSLVDICEDDCGLCATLGCLRPEVVDGETFRAELDLVQMTSARAVVLPPSSLFHPDLDSMVREIRNRDLEPIVRIRPRQMVASEELVRTLEFRGAVFEVVIDRPLSETEIVKIEDFSEHVFAIVVVLNRWIDAEAVIEALPAFLRRKISLLAPAQAGERFHSPDTIYRLTTKTPLRGFSSAGVTQGRSRFLETGLRAKTSYERKSGTAESIRMSVVVPVRDGNCLPCLEALTNQSLSKDSFEVLVVCDRTSDSRRAEIENFVRNAPLGFSATVLSLEDHGVDARAFRAGVARNAGAFRARGDLVVFLDQDAVAPTNLLRTALDTHHDADVVQFKRHDASSELEEYWAKFYTNDDWMSLPERWKYVSSFALSLRLKDFLDVGGFPPVMNRYGCEDTFLGWKLARRGLSFSLSSLAVEHVGPAARRASSRAKMLRMTSSARAFYLATLDPDVYRVFFTVLGRFSSLRWLVRSLAGTMT